MFHTEMNNSELNRLIKLILRHPCIYDRKHWGNTTKSHRDKIWRKISNKMRHTGLWNVKKNKTNEAVLFCEQRLRIESISKEALCRDTWNRLKDKYRREKLKIKKQNLNGPTKITESSWKYFDDMAQIDSSLTSEKKKGSPATEKSDPVNEADDSDRDSVESFDESDNMTLSTLLKESQASAGTQGPERDPENHGSPSVIDHQASRLSCNNSPQVETPQPDKIAEINEVFSDDNDKELMHELKMIREAKMRRDQDDNSHFLLSLRSYMNSLTPNDRLTFRCETQRILGTLLYSAAPSEPSFSPANNPNYPPFHMLPALRPPNIPDFYHPNPGD